MSHQIVSGPQDQKIQEDKEKVLILPELPHKFTPRPYQRNFFIEMDKGKKRGVWVAHRRAGKDKCAWNYMIREALTKKGVYFYFFPTFSQARKVIWDSMDNDGLKFLDHIPKQCLLCPPNNQEMKIKLINGSLIQLVGTDNYDSVMGTNPCGCVFSEYALQNPNAWQFIRPILDANGGWAIFIFTPRGANHAKELYDMACNNPDWFCEKLTIKETGVISDEMLNKIRAEGTIEDIVQQEYFCSFTLGIQGSYYARYLQQAKDEDRICHMPYQKQKKVCTAWDVGYNDETAIIFFQCIGQEIHIIDYHEDRQREAAHYAKILIDKPYIYDRHFAPHDVCAHQKGDGFELRSVYSNLGVDFTVLKLDQIKSIVEGIECARSLFPACYFDGIKCKMLIQSLENYRQQYDKTREYYSNKPVHDKWSNAADAFRYLCIGCKLYMYSDRGVSDDETDRMRDRYQPRFT